MSKMHLRQTAFIYSTYWPFKKKKKKEQGRFETFEETGNSRYIYQNKLDKVSFRHDMVCEDYIDLAKRTVSDNVLHHKTFEIAKHPN